MTHYEFGDLRFRWQGEFSLAEDEFTNRFLVPDSAGICPEEEIVFESCFEPLERFHGGKLLEKNGTYELYQTEIGRVIIFHWAQCRFAYGFPLSHLTQNGPLKIWFNPEMKQQIPLAAVRFFSTAGLHTKLLQNKAPILHASYIDFRSEAILFTAPSQTGKSTQADLWVKHAGAEIINGDRVLLRRRNDQWHAFGYPCCGSSYICENRTLPLRAIVVLEQGQENKVLPMTTAEKVRALFTGIERYLWDTQEMDIALNLAQELALETDVVRLVCRPDAQAVSVLQDYLK